MATVTPEQQYAIDTAPILGGADYYGGVQPTYETAPVASEPAPGKPVPTIIPIAPDINGTLGEPSTCGMGCGSSGATVGNVGTVTPPLSTPSTSSNEGTMCTEEEKSRRWIGYLIAAVIGYMIGRNK